MCAGGNSRSVAMAYILKSLKHCAVAIGHEHSTDDLKEILFRWADYIIIMQPYMIRYVPEQYHYKTTVCDVGEDKYFLGYKQELLKQCLDFYNMCFKK